jgi:hypothetical protein
MKKKIALFFLLAIFLSAGVLRMAAQEREKSVITVKKSDVVTGVIVVSVQRDKAPKTFTLQCNQGAPSCNQLKSGKYQMVELPSNSGMYDCKDVQVYAETADTEDADQRLGEYCLVE